MAPGTVVCSALIATPGTGEKELRARCANPMGHGLQSNPTVQVSFQDFFGFLEFSTFSTFSEVACTHLPEVANAKIEVPDRFLFGDVARVVCNSGFTIDGPEEIRCLANQTVSSTPKCIDIDECSSGVSQCQSLGTQCVNLPGSYMCQCLDGYQPQLSKPAIIYVYCFLYDSF